ncbi:hypothetical protein SUDANB1_05594 [Streptomyces sp. enrichment culture]|uniref:hypothetical protein n=1 Tax=Streptomyces sp. enrichment culture TaxID=1795815 RepID=UPI003F55B38B
MTAADELHAGDELRAAAKALRPSSPAVAAHAIAVRVPPAVVEAVADLLDDQADGDDEGVINPWALAVARAVNGTALEATGG